MIASLSPTALSNTGDNFENPSSEQQRNRIQLAAFVKSPGPHYFTKAFKKQCEEELIKLKEVSESSSSENNQTVEDGEKNIHRAMMFDVDLAVRVLGQWERRRKLVAEAIAYITLVALYFAYFLLLRYNRNMNWMPRNVLDEIVFERIPIWRPSYLQNSQLPSTISNSSCYGDVIYGSCNNLLPCVLNPNVSNHSFMVNPEITSSTDLNNQSGTCILSRTQMDFTTMSTMTDFISWMDNIFIKSSLFGNYSGRSVMSGVNLVIGSIRLRQVRMAPFSCIPEQDVSTTPSMFQNRTCVPYYSYDDEDRNPLVLNNTGITIPYQDADELAVTTFPTVEQQTVDIGWPNTLYRSENVVTGYGYGGYVVDFASGDRKAAIELWTNLKKDHFVSPKQGTSAVFLTFTLFNPGTEIFLFSQFMVEFLPSGSVIGTVDTRAFISPTLSDSQATSAYNVLIAALVVSSLFLGFFLFNLYQEFLFTRSWSSVVNGWIILDLLQLALMQATLWMQLSIYSGLGNDISISLNILSIPGTTTYASFFDAYSYRNARDLALIGTSVIISGFKFFKYLDLYPRLGIVPSVLRESQTELLGWALLFCSLYLVYSFSAYFMYGVLEKSFKTLGYSSLTSLLYIVRVFIFDLSGNVDESLAYALNVIRSAIGDFREPGNLPSLRGLESFSPYSLTTPLLWFSSLVVLFNWVLLEMMNAIIIYGYSKVSKRIAIAEAEQKAIELSFSSSLNSSQGKDRGLTLLNLFFSWRSQERIALRFRADQDLQRKRFISIKELREVVKRAIPEMEDNFIDALVSSLSRVFSVELKRLDESLLIAEQVDFLARNASSPVKRFPIRSLGSSSSTGGDQDEDEFDPNAEDSWLESLFVGDTLLSIAFIEMYKSVRINDHLLDICKEIERNQEKILSDLRDFENKALKLTTIDRRGMSSKPNNSESRMISDTIEEDPLPINPKQQSVVDGITKSPDGFFYAYFAPENAEKATYLGKFKTYKEADTAYIKWEHLILSKEKKMEEIQNEEKKTGRVAKCTQRLCKPCHRLCSKTFETSKTEEDEQKQQDWVDSDDDEEEIFTISGRLKNRFPRCARYCTKFQYFLNTTIRMIYFFERAEDPRLVCTLTASGKWIDYEGKIVDLNTRKPREIVSLYKGN